MKRIDLQILSDLRLRESRALMDAGCPDGAYYLAGYAVECALKACIARRTREFDFPEKELVNKSHTHDLGKLLKLAELEVELEILFQSDPAMRAKWATILQWNEEGRYHSNTRADASDLLTAIEDGTGGILPWIKARW
jgi:HEPN domain-containing protein